MAIDAIKQLNTGIVTGAQNVSSDNTIMTYANLNKSVGKSYATSNAGTEDLEQNEKVDVKYIEALLNKILNGRITKLILTEN